MGDQQTFVARAFKEWDQLSRFWRTRRRATLSLLIVGVIVFAGTLLYQRPSWWAEATDADAIRNDPPIVPPATPTQRASGNCSGNFSNVEVKGDLDITCLQENAAH